VQQIDIIFQVMFGTLPIDAIRKNFSSSSKKIKSGSIKQRDAKWTKSIADGDKKFVLDIKSDQRQYILRFSDN
jgi:hypothetical protein